ncbi:hypothetical protein ACH5RR_037396 [Cinchona calisaya]|uniref:Disease resistance R13L4/SHOC-2-like LRR domain-containing protein n=1 Tax=Cinchona calisaya TaxID=153742 RepID=A0ABD2Y600_9GENT
MDQVVWFNLSFFIRTLKLVRVLDLSQIHLGCEIELLVQLRYLAVQGMMKTIPSSIVNLSNLETFVLHFSGWVVLPDNIWNLKKLRHLEMKGNYPVGFCLPNDNLDNYAELCNLDTFSTAILSWENWEKILRKFPNIRELKGKLLEYGVSAGESNKVLVLYHLSRLESLNVYSYEERYAMQYQIEFFPLNLRKLTLSGFKLPWCKISAIGCLPNLEVLKLLKGAFEGEVWNMEEAGQFLKVRFLKLASFRLVRWTASE